MVSAKKEQAICLSCGECCKRYWITVLPDEAKKIAKKLNISEKKFLEEECVLLVNVYPKSTMGLLTYPVSFLPNRIHNLLEKISNPQAYFIIPQVVLRRQENVCTLLDDENKCVAYSVRPEPCKLFPFIAVKGFREAYPFCELYKKKHKSNSKISRAYSKKMKKYFSLVAKKGFQKVWKTPPKKGLVFHFEQKIGEISLQEINEIQENSL